MKALLTISAISSRTTRGKGGCSKGQGHDRRLVVNQRLGWTTDGANASFSQRAELGGTLTTSVFFAVAEPLPGTMLPSFSFRQAI
ncbi:MAG: hypothetical protein EOS79_22395 [Mesorhizobium sp.]|uniref:hypothetical protein n=1 Tax=Mesorhizobium sp. TaxID=1871066 RepID=UPI000FE47475|nr:hypothetical protein [Mesorhizobium sp.]RWE38821.1 MAG: hypothetical protein EOS79_22395 [Mesorhizobium sp.]